MKKIFSIMLSLCLFGSAYGTAFTTDCGNTVSITATPATGYHFTQWQDGNTDNPRQVEVKSSANFTASFAPNEYTILFVNEDGTELQKSLMAYGTTPVYNGATPTKPASNQYTYTFVGWTPAIAIVTSDATYTATYTSSVNSYTLTLSGENGVVTGAGSYEYGSVVNISATPLECYQFKQWSDGDTNATREITITDDIELEAIFEVITYTITIESANQEHGTVTIEVVGNQGDAPSANVPNDGHEYVDLGLPSGLLWATCNVGANTPYEPGDYFAWGETEPKEVYDWSTYKWCKGDKNSLTKYTIPEGSSDGFVDYKTRLEPADDAANANWGGNWRMPTDDEWQELQLNCEYYGNGLFISRNNGNRLILPTTSYKENNSIYTNTTNHGYHLLSSLSNSSERPCVLYFYSMTLGNGGHTLRYQGVPVRPVWSSSPNSNLPTFRDVSVYYNTTSNSATVNLMIADDGGSYVTEYGVCYSTSENPTIMDNIATCYYCYGKAGNAFDLTDLEAGTTYYVRAYATNSNGTGYSEQIEFTTLSTK